MPPAADCIFQRWPQPSLSFSMKWWNPFLSLLLESRQVLWLFWQIEDSRSGGGLSPSLALSARRGVRPCGETRRHQGRGEGTQPPYLNKASGERPGWKKPPSWVQSTHRSLRDNGEKLCEPLDFSVFTARDAQDSILAICFSLFCPGKGVLTNW